MGVSAERRGVSGGWAAYLSSIQRHPVLEADVEHDLALRVFRDGDAEAAEQLAVGNLRLVLKIAHKYCARWRGDPMDLVQQGNLGLLHAVRRFDPHRGVKFSTYAGPWIRAYILQFLLGNLRLVKVGTTQAQRRLVFHLSREQARLLALGIEPTAEAVGGSLGVPPSLVEEMCVRLGTRELSLDALVDGGNGRSESWLDRLPAPDSRPDDLFIRAWNEHDVTRKLGTFARTLGARDRLILDARLLSEEPATLEQLGAVFGVSRERARQLEKRLIDSLRRFLLRTTRDEGREWGPLAHPVAGPYVCGRA